ncbi:hypothetical protein QQX98_000738 [Neonectria punicea]|uniref:2EXR domain-containing protein n=1 Tax=Neonectria punicea TaxID=979145 RepID=A0ABR1HRP0_9HYPO
MFKIPPDCRSFSPFARLPAEIRHQIWENALATPGMHFLKIESREPGSWWTPDFPHAHFNGTNAEDAEADDLAVEVQREIHPAFTQQASLLPLYPIPKADISYYTTLNQEITKLSVTCNESAAIAKHLMTRPSTLTLDRGRMISLDIASDIIYLEYVPPAIFENGFLFSKNIECAGLERIRKVAVRYCHKWYERNAQPHCSVCGQVHNPADRIPYPKHLYQFIAQYLPNVEQFYFVDYFILRKPINPVPLGIFDERVAPTTIRKDKKPLEKFEGGNRTYFEVDPPDWTIRSNVFETLSWVQNRFVRYAKTSALSSHKSPGNVKFGVLACEWTRTFLDERKAPSTSIKKGCNKRTFCEDHNSWGGRRNPHRSPALRIESPPVEVPGNFPFVFGVEGSNNFSFTFSVPR